MSIRSVFFRCNSGHYFIDQYCPWDGWTHPSFAKVLSALKTIDAGNVTLAELRKAGLSDELLQRVMIVEFGNAKSRFDAISPEEVMSNGKIYKLHNFDRDFL